MIVLGQLRGGCLGAGRTMGTFKGNFAAQVSASQCPSSRIKGRRVVEVEFDFHVKS